MKFKILKGTPTFERLDAFHKEMKRCNKLAAELAIELGGSKEGNRLAGFDALAGGITGIEMDVKPELWRDASRYGFVFPKMLKANKEILDKIKALPIATRDELNSIVGFEYQATGMRWHNGPGVVWRADYILLNVDSECYFTPNEDMIEILDSEYKKLSEEN